MNESLFLLLSVSLELELQVYAQIWLSILCLYSNELFAKAIKLSPKLCGVQYGCNLSFHCDFINFSEDSYSFISSVTHSFDLQLKVCDSFVLVLDPLSI